MEEASRTATTMTTAAATEVIKLFPFLSFFPFCYNLPKKKALCKITFSGSKSFLSLASADSIEAILALSDRKCKKKGEFSLSITSLLVGPRKREIMKLCLSENDVCDLEDVPGRVLLCLTQLQHRTKALEGRALSNEQGNTNNLTKFCP